MYTLIREKLASKFELEEYYTLDEALKLWALYRMQQDIESAQNAEISKENARRR
jgi:hypothetical protein